VNAVYLPMTFISGSFFSTRSFPDFLEAVSDVLPLTFLLRLLRTLFIDGETLASHPGWLAALTVWGVAGLAIALRTFRWEPRSA